MKFIHIRNRAYDRYVREDNEVCLEQRMVRINGRFCWRWCVYADCGGNVVEMFKTLKAAKRLLRCARLMMALLQGSKPFCHPWQDGRGSQTAKECQL